MRKLFGGATAAVLALTVGAGAVFAANPPSKPGTSSIVDIVVADSRFDVLQAAVGYAGLVGALSSTDDQYTVFAPTDAAFEALFGASEAAVIAAINSDYVDTAFGEGALVDILLYHVTDGRRTAQPILSAPRYVMLNEDTLTRDYLSAAGISQPNVSASNGVIHVIDSVLLPPSYR